MVNKKQVMDVLRECIDPEININIVDLGLVYGVEVDRDKVRVKMTLTTPGCPMSSYITEDVKSKIEGLDGVKSAEVELVWDPPWTPERMSESIKKQIGFE